MKPPTSSRPVIYLTAFNENLLLITGASLLRFLNSVGLTHPDYSNYFIPTSYISINKHAPFFKLLTRLPFHRLMHFIMSSYYAGNLMHNKGHIQLKRPWRHILSRKRLTLKKKLTWPEARTPNTKPAHLKSFCTHHVFSHIILSSPVVFSPIPPIVHVYGHSPLLLFPRAGVG